MDFETEADWHWRKEYIVSTLITDDRHGSMQTEMNEFSSKQISEFVV